jgi:hypothetical protein
MHSCSSEQCWECFACFAHLPMRSSIFLQAGGFLASLLFVDTFEGSSQHRDASTINENHSARTRLPTRLFHEEEDQFVPCVFISIKHRVWFSFHVSHERVSRWIKPSTTSLVLATFTDLTRGPSELLAENALLRHQLIMLRRQIKRPASRKRDRLLLGLLASMVRTWKQALFLVQPQTILRLPS